MTSAPPTGACWPQVIRSSSRPSQGHGASGTSGSSTLTATICASPPERRRLESSLEARYMSGDGEKRWRLRHRTLTLLALATAIGSAGLAASIPTRLRPHVEGLGEVSMGLAAGAGAPIAGLVLALGGFAALSFGGALVAAAAVFPFLFLRQAA